MGYIANGFYGTKFDLNSVWAGVAAISAAGVISLGRHWTDSAYNSLPGKPPDTGGGLSADSKPQGHPDNG